MNKRKDWSTLYLHWQTENELYFFRTLKDRHFSWQLNRVDPKWSKKRIPRGHFPFRYCHRENENVGEPCRWWFIFHMLRATCETKGTKESPHATKSCVAELSHTHTHTHTHHTCYDITLFKNQADVHTNMTIKGKGRGCWASTVCTSKGGLRSLWPKR
jgi:hypothetical protein